MAAKRATRSSARLTWSTRRSADLMGEATGGAVAGARAARAGRVSPRGRKAFHILPAVELASLAALFVAPFLLSDRPELITLMTNIVILSLLAISFDLCWGFSGIMSFGQALFFGVSGYVVALVGRDLDFSPIWGTLPLALLVGLGLSLLFAGMLLLGRKTPTPIFVALGTL